MPEPDAPTEFLRKKMLTTKNLKTIQIQKSRKKCKTSIEQSVLIQ